MDTDEFSRACFIQLKFVNLSNASASPRVEYSFYFTTDIFFLRTQSFTRKVFQIFSTARSIGKSIAN